MSISNASANFGLSAIATSGRPLITTNTVLGQTQTPMSLTTCDNGFYASLILQDPADTATLDTNDYDVTLTANAAVAATGVLTLTGNAVAAQTVTIGSVTYTFRASVSTTANEVLVGATASDSLDNLIAAINAGAGSGTLYGSATVAHPQVSAAAGTGDTMNVTADTAGAAGNSIATTETMTNGSFGAATLTGGADANAWSGASLDFEGVDFAVNASIQGLLVYCSTGSVTVSNSTDLVIPVPATGKALIACPTGVTELLGTLTFTAESANTLVYITSFGTV